MQLQVSSPGKLLVFGEHIILNGGSGLGIPLPLFLEARFKSNDSRSTQLLDTREQSSQAQTSQLQFRSCTSLPDDFIEYSLKTCEEEGLSIPSGTIHISSKIPVARGLGSSAALCSSLAKIILKYNNKILTRRRLWYLAHIFEQFYHKPASGIDTAISTYACSLLLQTEKKVKVSEPALTISKIKQNKGVYLVLATLPRTKSSAEAIQHVQRKFQQTSIASTLQMHTKKAIENLLSVSQGSQDSQSRKKIKSFANDIESIHSIHTDLGLCPRSMQSAINSAKQAGAFSAKLSGAGFGGAFVNFCESKEDADNVLKVLHRNKKIELLLKINPNFSEKMYN